MTTLKQLLQQNETMYTHECPHTYITATIETVKQWLTQKQQEVTPYYLRSIFIKDSPAFYHYEAITIFINKLIKELQQ